MITKKHKFRFQEKVRGFMHQSKTLNETWERSAYALFWEMGAGKTKTILDTAVMLFCEGEIDGLLVICDNGAYRNWADYEIPTHVPDNIPYRVGVWSSHMSRREEHQVNQLLVARDDCLDFLIMNVEAFSSKRAPIFAEAFARAHYAMGVIDESTSIKNPNANRTRMILSMRDLFDYRRILTGTPMANSPMDLYTQFEWLGPRLLGFDSFTAFRSRYAKLLLIRTGRCPYYQITGYKNLDELTTSMVAHSSRVLKSECLDLPEKTYQVIDVQFTDEQRRRYEEVKELCVTQLESGELVTANMALTNLIRLQQICCGFVKDDDDVTHLIKNDRINMLLETLEHIDGKAVIWCHFRRDIEMVCASLPPDSWVNYHGGTSPDDRTLAISEFRGTPQCRYFVSNPATGGKGITLVEASYAIYYSNGFSLMNRLQSEDRIHRPGQRNTCTYIDLAIPNTVDHRIMRALKMKKDLATQVLDEYRNLLGLS